MNQDITSVKRGMKRFLDSQARGQKVYYQPWYSVYNIAPLANQTTGLLSPQTIPFFQVGRGQVGNGFNRPLTGAETSLPIGANGVMPGGIEFIATHLGVDLFPSLPDPVKEGFTEKSFLVQKRLSHESFRRVRTPEPVRLDDSRSDDHQLRRERSLRSSGASRRCRDLLPGEAADRVRDRDGRTALPHRERRAGTGRPRRARRSAHRCRHGRMVLRGHHHLIDTAS